MKVTRLAAVVTAATALLATTTMSASVKHGQLQFDESTLRTDAGLDATS